MAEKMTPCAECGMPCEPGEYHPYAACLMFKGCYNSTTVRANLTQPAQAFGPSTNEGTNCVNPGAAPIVAPENAQPAQAVDVQQWQFRQQTDEGWSEWQNIAPQHVDTVERRSDCEVRGLGVITRALGTAQAEGYVLIRKEAIDWLNGESDFECPPDRYFRGEPPRYWWRSVFREKAGLAASPTPPQPEE